MKTKIAEEESVVDIDSYGSVLKWFSGKALQDFAKESVPILIRAKEEGFIGKKDLRRVVTQLSKMNMPKKMFKKIADSTPDGSYSSFNSADPRLSIEFPGNEFRTYEDYEASSLNRTKDALWGIYHFCFHPTHKNLDGIDTTASDGLKFDLLPFHASAIELIKSLKNDLTPIFCEIAAYGEGLSASSVQKFRLQPASRNAEKDLESRLVSAIEPLKAELIEANIRRFHSDLERFRKLIEANDKERAYRSFHRSSDSTLLKICFSKEMPKGFFDVKDNFDGISYIEHNDSDQRLQNYVKNVEVPNLITFFIKKNIQKAGSLISSQGFGYSVNEMIIWSKVGVLEGRVDIELENGTFFSMRTTTRWNVSSKAKYFLQLPTIYQNVKFRGKDFGAQSEEEIAILFGAAILA